MFESLSHWFDSIREGSRLFNNADDERLHAALASVLYHIIDADSEVSAREKAAFVSILDQEFDLDEEQALHLFEAARSSTCDLHDDLHTINRYLKQGSMVRLHFMKYLIRLSDIDGLHDYELEVFNEAMREVFPDCKPL